MAKVVKSFSNRKKRYGHTCVAVNASHQAGWVMVEGVGHIVYESWFSRLAGEGWTSATLYAGGQFVTKYIESCYLESPQVASRVLRKAFQLEIQLQKGQG